MLSVGGHGPDCSVGRPACPIRHVRCNAIEHPLRIPPVTQEPGVFQHCQMPGDFGLRQLKGGDQFANAELFPSSDQSEAAEADRVGQGGEDVGCAHHRLHMRQIAYIVNNICIQSHIRDRESTGSV